MDLLDRLSLEYPIFQAGMGEFADATLAGTVSRAGGLGTIGLTHPKRLVDEIRKTRMLAPQRPLAVNLLLPFVRDAHVEVCIQQRVTAVVLFFGHSASIVKKLHDAGIVVLHQVGTPAQAKRAIADGADVLIAQGLQAGGHLLAQERSADVLPRVVQMAEGIPVIVAGGIADATDVRIARDGGASGVVVGSRFLLTHECAAPMAYKRRIAGSSRTIVTRLFGLGWPARHRVATNSATDRWCDKHGRGPRSIDLFNQFSAPLGRVASHERSAWVVRMQSLRLPFYSPMTIGEDNTERLEVTPLYAGEAVYKMTELQPAASVVQTLALGWSCPAPAGT